MPAASNVRQVIVTMDRTVAELVRAMDSAAETELDRAAEHLALVTPRGSGPGPHMADEYRIERHTPASWDLVNLSDHAGPVVYGARAHRIEPRRRQWLRWQDAALPGGYAFSRGVNHPGTPPNPAITAALDEEEAHLTAVLEETLARVVASFP